MRVISGTRKGCKLKGPRGNNTRPTEDRIKESLFNILRNIDNESIVLDLFAGSGGIGIEFLSRGAKKAYFVDKDYESIQCIRDNLIHTKLNDNAEVIKDDALKSIKKFGQKEIKFDYIFADPPYRKDIIMKIIECIWNNKVLKETGILILEHEKELILEDKIYGLRKADYRVYGDKSLSFYIHDIQGGLQ